MRGPCDPVPFECAVEPAGGNIADMINEALGAPWRRVLSFALCICSIVGPPTIFLAEYMPALFSAADASKLILLAIGLNSPIFIGNWLLCLEIVEREDDSTETSVALEHWHLTSAMLASLVSMIPLNLAALLKLLYYTDLKIVGGAWISIATTVVIWGICIAIAFTEKRERASKSLENKQMSETVDPPATQQDTRSMKPVD